MLLKMRSPLRARGRSRTAAAAGADLKKCANLRATLSPPKRRRVLKSLQFQRARCCRCVAHRRWGGGGVRSFGVRRSELASAGSSSHSQRKRLPNTTPWLPSLPPTQPEHSSGVAAPAAAAAAGGSTVHPMRWGWEVERAGTSIRGMGG